MQELEPLTAISSVDGRYRSVVEPLAKYFSEFGLIHKRAIVECEYLIALSRAGIGLREFTDNEKKELRNCADIKVSDAEIIKEIEREGCEGILATNHDVKAIEYYLKLKLKNTSLKDVLEWIHFGLTSEDINSVAYGFALRSALAEVLIPALRKITEIGRAHV